MDTVERNGGIAGLVAAACFALLLILTIIIGLDPRGAGNPYHALRVIARKSDLWGASGVVGAVSAGLGMVFAVGLFSRLRGQAPTRASAMLCFAVVGLGAYALASLMQWRGGTQLADFFSTKSEVPATNAWLALHAVISGLNALGAAFAGTSLVIAGWAVIATTLLNPIAGWVAVIAGILSIVTIFAPNSFGLFVAALVFAIVWLAWAGSELRQSQQK